MKYSEILVCTDLSDRSIKAVKEAAKWIDAEGTTISCLYVIPEKGEEAESFQKMYSEEASEAGAVEHAKNSLENWLSDIELKYADEFNLVVKLGEPYEEVLNYAQEEDIELIIVGTKGKSGFERFWAGSVAEAVIRRSPCPVMTVREEFPNVIEE